MTTTIFRLDQVQIRRVGRTLLHIDAWHVQRRERVVIMGPNGSGKTTLLKVCCGLLPPDRGRVWLGEDELTRLSAWQRTTRRRRIGYVPQATEFQSESPFTLRDVVAMGRVAVRGLLAPLTRQDEQQVDACIDRLGLTPLRHQMFRDLSGGEKQKTLIARVMVAQPEVLVLDEPLANLDVRAKEDIGGLLHEVQRESDLTVLLVCHEPTRLMNGARLVLLHQGQLAADGPAEEVIASASFRDIYGEVYVGAGSAVNPATVR